MSEAVFRVRTEGGVEVAKLLADIERAATSAQKRIDATQAASRQRMVRDTVAAQQAVGDGYRKTTVTIEREEKLITRAKLRELSLQEDAQKKFQERFVDAVKKATAAIEAEVGKRAQLSDREKRQIEELALAMINEHDRAEREKTAISVREAQRRKQRVDAIVRTAGQVMSAVGQAGRQIHGEVQDTRQRRAPAERALGNAIYQAGGTRADVQGAMGTVTRFAEDERMDTGELANAALAAQTEFSILGDARTRGPERERRLARFLETAKLARDTGNDVGEMARVQGLVETSGITDPAQQRQIMLHLAGEAQSGAVELGSVTREAMGALRGRMATAAQRAGASGGDVTAAQREALIQGMAEVEIARLAGEQPRAGANTMRDVTLALGSTVTGDKLYGNLHHIRNAEQRAALTSALFEDDPTRHGQHRLRADRRNALDFMQAFADAGVGTEDFMNLTRGGGHGNPMSMLSNQRRVLGQALLANGGIAHIRELMDPSTALTEGDVARGRDIFKNDQMSMLTGAQEKHDNALGDNTSALNQLSNALRDAATEHPIANAVFDAGKGLAETALAAHVLRPLATQAATPTTLLGRAAAAARSAGGAVQRGASGLAASVFGAAALPALATAGAVLSYTGDSIVSGDDEAAMLRRYRAAHAGAPGAARAPTGDASAAALRQAVREGVREGMQAATVTVSQHDAVHAATVAATQNAGAR